ncbi:MAG: hypothetical protein KGH69_03765 [Candidatus Micrarchaeota archaeon]|nr:hypothetical protein [Candidatus Micrarchaeota archaeon]
MRGREPPVTCSSCGRTVPRNKAVVDEKAIRFSTEQKEAEVSYFSTRKVYYCISCAKHRGIFQKKAERAARMAARRQGMRG